MTYLLSRLIFNPWPLILAALIFCFYMIPMVYVSKDIQDNTAWVSITPSNNQTDFNAERIIKEIDKHLKKEAQIEPAIWQIKNGRINGHLHFDKISSGMAEKILATIPSVLNNSDADSNLIIDWSINPHEQGELSIALRHDDNQLVLDQITDTLVLKWQYLKGISSIETKKDLLRWIPFIVEVGNIRSPLSINQNIIFKPEDSSQKIFNDKKTEPTRTIFIDINPHYYQSTLKKINQDLLDLEIKNKSFSFNYIHLSSNPISHLLFVFFGIFLIFYFFTGFTNSFTIFFIQLFTLCQICWIWPELSKLSGYTLCIWLTSFNIPIIIWYMLGRKKMNHKDLLRNVISAIRSSLHLQMTAMVLILIAGGTISYQLTLIPILSFINSLILIPVMTGIFFRLGKTNIDPPPNFFNSHSTTISRKLFFALGLVTLICYAQYLFNPVNTHRFIFKSPNSTQEDVLITFANKIRSIAGKLYSEHSSILWIKSYFSPSQRGFYHALSDENILGFELNLPWYHSTNLIKSEIHNLINNEFLELIPMIECNKFPFCAAWIPVNKHPFSSDILNSIDTIELPPSYIDGMGWSKSLNLITSNENDKNLLAESLFKLNLSNVGSNWSLIKKQPLSSSEPFTFADTFEKEEWIPTPDSRFYFKGTPLLEVNLLNSRYSYSSSSYKSLNKLSEEPLTKKREDYGIFYLITIILVAWGINPYYVRAIIIGWLVSLMMVLDTKFIVLNYPAWIFFNCAISLTLSASNKLSKESRANIVMLNVLSIAALLCFSRDWSGDAALVAATLPVLWIVQHQICRTKINKQSI